MEHYDGEFYTLRLFSPIEGEIYSLNSTEEGIHLTAYEMENYSSFIRDHMEGVGLLGKRNQKLMTYFNNAKRLHKPVSLSLDLEAYEGRLWSVLQADSQDKLTHEEVQSLAETWGMIAAGGFIREMQETRILVPDGELMVFLGNEGLKGTHFSKYKQFVNNCFDTCPRQALHAMTLGFVHPVTGEEMYFTSELPDDMTRLIEKWRGYISNRELE